MSEDTSLRPEVLHKTAQELYEQKASPEKEKSRELTPQESALKEELRALSATSPHPQTEDEIAQAINDLLSLDDRAQLAELVRLAFNKNVIFALKVARDLNPLIMDTFHDLLARDENYRKLLKENKL